MKPCLFILIYYILYYFKCLQLCKNGFKCQKMSKEILLGLIFCLKNSFLRFLRSLQRVIA